MGCAVNGPGEARDADFALVGGRGMGAIYSKGTLLKSGIPEKNLVAELLRLIKEKS
jgi:(E)-4-hydroxy-3-methylbut-2-enyl-diphosphate synthase